ncbi:MAG: protein tyrosine kinase modulator [Acidobacteriota bacterium]|jgi:polysaccharide chain length determinant protein (PEP-CTERM system associated)
MEERAFHPLDYLSVVKRRKWWLIAPLALGAVVGLLLALLWPKDYISQAKIGIAAPTLSPELLRGVSSLDKEERQRAISQQLLSRQVLERVAREEKLDPSKPVEDVAGWLRSRVVVQVDQPIGRMENKNGLDSFDLGYMDSEPDRAQRITNRLAYVFVEENSKTRTSRAENTSEVLGQQTQASLERLTQLEAQLRTKKEANMGRLPTQVNANTEMVRGLRQSLDSYSLQLRTEEDRLSQIEAQLEDMRRGTGSTAMTSSATSTVHTIQARKSALQQELAQARALGYTDKHPEIDRLKSEIAQADAELASINKAGNANGDLLQADPMYRQRLADRESARMRINTLRAQSANASRQIADYQSRVEAAPMVEENLAAITREVDLERARYTDLKNTYDKARSAEDLARKQGGERFSVLYPASPGVPASPTQQLKLFMIPIVLGFVLGAMLAVGREFMDRSVHDARELQSEFEVPVLGEIPKIHGAA